MTETILNRIWELSPNVEKVETYQELQSLTNNLTAIYQEQGRLTTDPFSEARERTIHTPFEKIKEKLKSTTCLVTGGLGCIGSKLVQQLLKYDVQEIIILDNSPIPYTNSKIVTRFDCDIRNSTFVNEIFAVYRPEYVFHTAAQRDPGLAETTVVETVTTNVLGTNIIVKACETCGSVKQMVSCSTGKSSRYYTEEVYAATKKMGEFIIDTFSTHSHIKYSLIRCTHIIDNSLMNMELKKSVEADAYLKVHSPGKYITAQNATEAVSLILNALLYARERQCRFLLVKNLSWPVESLEVALYYRVQSGRDIPVVFSGNPMGYAEKFFRGQTDWSKPEDLNLLVNAYETPFKRIVAEGDIIMSRPCSTNMHVLGKVLNKLENIHSETAMRECLITGLKEMVQESLKKVERNKTIDILRWGLDQSITQQNTLIADFNPLVQLLAQSLEGSIYYPEADELLHQPA
jgi:dTDP-4-dehydrorhamnose reductase